MAHANLRWKILLRFMRVIVDFGGATAWIELRRGNATREHNVSLACLLVGGFLTGSRAPREQDFRVTKAMTVATRGIIIA